jgi:putative copper export protein
MEISFIEAGIEAGLYAADRLALALLIGVSAVWLISNSDQRAIATPALRRLFDVALIILPITTIEILLLRTASLAEVGVTETLPFIARVISGSPFGALWLGRVAVLLLLIVMWVLSRRALSPSRCTLIAAGALITAFCISGVSHAGDDGAFTFDNFINTAHIAAGCLWGGAIIAYAAMLKAVRQHAAITIAASAERLSTVATFALVTVVTTGAFNSWQRLEVVSELWSSDYGLTLLLKLSFVTIMMSIGAFNRFYAVPAIVRGQSGAAQRLLYLLHVDTILFLFVISCAAALGMQSPSH